MKRLELTLLVLSLVAIVSLAIHSVNLAHELNTARGDAEMCDEVLIHTCNGETYACETLRGE